MWNEDEHLEENIELYKTVKTGLEVIDTSMTHDELGIEKYMIRNNTRIKIRHIPAMTNFFLRADL